MPRLFRAVALIGVLLLAQPAFAQRLRLVADAWPPFTDATLINGGLATDIVSTALARAGYASDFEQVPWARALMGVVVQLLKVLECNGIVTPLDETHAVEQVFAGKLPQVRARIVVPGVHQHVITSVAHPHQCPGPGRC